MPGPPDAAEPLADPGDNAVPLPPQPARRPLAAVGEMVVCSGFPTQILLAILVRAAGVPDATSDGQISLPFVAVVSLADTALLIWLMLWFLQARGQSGAALWLGSRPILPEIVRGVLLTPLILAGVGLLLLAIQQWAPQLRTVPVNPLEALARRGADGCRAARGGGRDCGRRPRGAAASLPGGALRAVTWARHGSA